MPKKTLRQFMLQKRSDLDVSAVMSASLTIQMSFVDLPAFAGARVVCLYAPVRNEVETALVMQKARDMGKTVLYPAVSSDGIEFHSVEELSGLKKGTFGVPEPEVRHSPQSSANFDLVIVPGVAFDLRGNRIGYGKGYYDKVLHRLEGCGKLVAFCYDFQLVDEIVGEPHDVMMDTIITEKRLISPRH